MIYVWVKWDKCGEWQPHMTFKNADKEDAKFEVNELKYHGHGAKFGDKFPSRKDILIAKRNQYIATNAVAYPEDRDQWPMLLKLEAEIAKEERV